MRPLLAVRPGWPGWSRRTEVERVRLYTVTLLEVMMWTGLLLVALSGLLGRRPELVAVLVGCSVVLGLAATPLLRGAAPAYAVEGAPARTPALTMAGVAVAGAVIALLLPDGFRQLLAGLVAALLAVAFGGYRGRRLTVVLLAAVVVVPTIVTPSWATAAYLLSVGAFLVFTVRSSLWLLAVVTELDRARGARAALAVAEERLRFSRDLHDVLGRRLSTIALQAELAGALARRGDPTAAERMGEVRATAHEALREARELARGYRPTSLAQELDGARSLLNAAGIDCVIAVDGLPEPWHEPAAWVVREAVTNVLRHSAARRVTVDYRGGELVVGNDGAVDVPGPTGSGLTGLAERLAPLGATLESRRDGTDHTLRVTLPAVAGAR